MRVVLLVVILVAGCDVPQGPTGGAATTTPAAKVYGRAEFREMLMGKTPAEVIAAVGKPDRTADDTHSQLWTYVRRTKDPVTGKLDSDTFVHFRDGKVVRVNF
jgi:outer membrane protein assembly factor BamE (lipoprotein component of BamABCDE complex)